MNTPESTCWSLVLGAASGRPSDREEFCRRYGPVIKAYLGARWRLSGDDARVEDVSQEVLLQCIKPGGALEGLDPHRRSGFHSYLYAVSSNVALMNERTHRRRKEHDASPSVFERHGTDAELSREFDRAWALLVLREARELMRERAERSGREALERVRTMDLRYEEELPPREIGPRLGRDVPDVYRDLEKGRNEIKACLFEVMADYHPQDSEGQIRGRCEELLSLLASKESDASG